MEGEELPDATDPLRAAQRRGVAEHKRGVLCEQSAQRIQVHGVDNREDLCGHRFRFHVRSFL
jgi:hypothetical protein